MPTVLKSGPGAIFTNGTGISNSATNDKITTSVGDNFFMNLKGNLFFIFFVIVNWNRSCHSCFKFGQSGHPLMGVGRP